MHPEPSAYAGLFSRSALTPDAFWTSLGYFNLYRLTIGAIFLGLSGYALTTRKDFSFLGGFLMTGFIVVLLAALANIFLAIPALSLTISAAVILIMSGFILYDTSRMVREGASANYLLMTVSLYLSMFNIFINLLHLLGFASGDD